jgi:hypothetical protein
VADRLVLHIGAPKSGTTYLQSMLWANKRALRAGGVLVPGRQRHSHTRAASAINSGLDRERGQWRRLVQQAAAYPGTLLISDEWLVKAGRAQIAVALADLVAGVARGPGSVEPEVHVVFTARDLTRQVPAGWQEELKLGRGIALDDFVAGLADPTEKWSWRTLDPAVVLPEWEAVVPADRIHVVTVPGSGAPRDLLWRRYAAAVGFDADLAAKPATEENESLGVAAARLYQEIGPRLRDAVGADEGRWTTQYRWLRRYVGHELLVPLGGDRIALSPEAHATVRERALASVAAIGSSGWDVIGDLDDLVGAAEPSGRRPDAVTDAEMLEVAVGMVERLLADLRRATEGAGAPEVSDDEEDA